MQKDSVREIEELIRVFEEVSDLDFDALSAFTTRAELVIQKSFPDKVDWFLNKFGIVDFYTGNIGGYTNTAAEQKAWESGKRQMTDFLNLMKEEALKRVEDLPALPTGVQIKTGGADSQTSSEHAQDPRKVFVVHGRNAELRNAMFWFLRSLDLSPIEWSQAISSTGSGSPYIGQVLDAAFEEAQAIVVLMTPDDEAKLRDLFLKPSDNQYERELTPQARPNVLFEAGLAMGRNPNRTILVEVGSLRPFSDIGGRHTVRLDNSPEKRRDLATRLRKAGCQLNDEGTDWFTAGDFELKDFLISKDGKITLPSSDAERDQWAETVAHEASEKNLSVADLARMLKAAGSVDDMRAGVSAYKRLKSNE